MADNQFKISVVVTDNGGTKIAEKNLDALGAAVKRTGGAHRGAKKDTQDFFDTQAKGVIGTANSTRSFSKLAESIGKGGSSGLVGAYATLAANVFAVTAAFGALRNASQVEQVFKGLEASGARTGQALTVTARKMRDVAGASIDMEQSLRSTAQIAAGGFGEETILRLTQAAKDASFALGRNMTDSLDRLTRGIIKLEPELLDELGVMTKLTQSNTDYARSLNKNATQLTAYEKSTGFLNAVLAEIEIKFGDLSATAGDTTAYDKLAATFSDLRTETLSTLNTGLRPLVGILAANPTALLGVITLFASTIARQLLPSLANVASGNLKAAAASAQHVKDLRIETNAIIQKEKALESAAMAALKSSKLTSGPKKYNANIDAFNAGTADDAQKAAINKSLNTSINTNERLLKKFEAAGETNKAAAKATQLTALKEERDRITQLEALRNNSAKAEVERQASTRRALYLTLAARKQVAAQEGAAAAIGAASQLQITAALQQVIGATKKYAESLQAKNLAAKEAVAGDVVQIGVFDRLKAGANTISSAFKGMYQVIGAPNLSGMDKLRTLTFGVATAAKAMGAAFLSAIPLIGQAVFIFGLLKAGLSALKSDSVKKLEKAYTDFNDVLESTQKSLESLNRANMSLGPAYVRSSQAIIIQSNALTTLIDAYDEVMKKQAESADQAKKGTGVAGLLSATFALTEERGAADAASYWTGVAKGSKALPSAMRMTGNSLLGTQDKEVEATAKALDQVIKLAPEATDRVMSYYGGWAKYNKLPRDQWVATSKALFEQIKSNYGAAAENVKALTDAFKNLDQSIGDWALAAQQTTPFDMVTKNFQAATNGISKFQVASAKLNTMDTSKWKDLLTGLGGNTSNFLSVDTTKQLADLNEANDKVQQLEKARATSSDKERANYDKLLESAKRRRDGMNGILNTVNEELAATQAQFELAQRNTREMKTQQSLLQANLTANQANFAATASGVAARMKGENAIKELQISELKVQKDLLTSYMAQTQAQITSLEIESKRLEIQARANKYVDEGNILRRQEAAHLRESAAIERLRGAGLSASEIDFNPAYSQNLTDDQKKIVDAYKRTKAAAEDLDKLQSNYQGIKEAKQQVEAYRSSVANLVSQMQALKISESTSGQISAEAAAKRAEIINQQTAQLVEQQKTLEAIRILEVQTGRLSSGRAESLADQLTDIQAAAKATKIQADSSYQNARRTLDAELAKARADTAVANNGDAKKANADRISLLQEQVRLEEQGYRVNLLQIDASTRNEILQKAAFDTQSAGLEMQQNALTYLEKQLSVRKDLVDAAQEEGTLTREIARRSRGIVQTDSSKQNDELQAAIAAYEFAVDEASLKRTTIKLEYALLDAQRQTALANLQTQRAALASVQGSNSDMVRQLDATIQGLSDASGYIQQAQAGALRLADKQENNARLRMRQAALPEGRGTSVAQSERDRRELRRARTEVNSGSRDIEPFNEAMKTVVVPFQKSSEALFDSNAELVRATDLLTQVNKQLADKQKGQESGTNSTLSRIPLARAEAIGKIVTDQLGNVITSATRRAGQAGRAGNKSHHVSSSAIDVRPKGGQNPQDVVDLLKSLGLKKVRFIDETTPAMMKKTGASGPHWHFDWDPVKPAMASLDKVTEAAITKVNEVGPIIAANAIVPVGPANDNTITVQGERPAVDNKTIKNAQAIKEPYGSDNLARWDDIMAKEGSISEVFGKMADQLGPQGEIMPAIIGGIDSIGSAYEQMRTVISSDSSIGDKFSAVASVAQAALSTISSVLASSAQAKQDAIQKEIDAETKRDGKSVESVAKLAALDKRKDEIARKSFNTNKKLMMAQAVIATAAGVANALGSGLPFPANVVLAGVIGAMGAAQLAIISGTSYQSSASTASAAATMPTLTIGKRGDTVDLAKQNNNVGGELGYLRGSQGTGSNASNYNVVGSAYGGSAPRGYGNTAYVVGEKGPETIIPEVPVTVRPANDNGGSGNMAATININALDSSGVEDIIKNQRGNIISMLREASNANGAPFMEDVDVNAYSRPNRANRL